MRKKQFIIFSYTALLAICCMAFVGTFFIVLIGAETKLTSLKQFASRSFMIVEAEIGKKVSIAIFASNFNIFLFNTWMLWTNLKIKHK